MIVVGTPGTMIDLPTQFNGGAWRLADARGKRNVLVLGYPLDWTPICGSELPELNRMMDSFRDDADTDVVSMSADSWQSHLAWSYQMREPIRFPMLSDMHPHGEVSRRLGLWIAEDGITDRGTVIFDKAGVVRYAEISGKNVRRTLPDLLHAAIEINGSVKPGRSMPSATAEEPAACDIKNPAACAMPTKAAGMPLPRAPAGFPAPPPRSAGQPQGPVLFLSNGCGACSIVRGALKSLPWQSVLEISDVDSAEGRRLAARLMPGQTYVPALVMPDGTYVGDKQVIERVKRLIAARR